MILRLTQKLARQLGERPALVLPPDPNPYADWTGNLFLAGRRPYVILTNTRSLYSLLFHGKGVTSGSEFARIALGRLRDYMTMDGTGALFDEFIAPELSAPSFSKTGNPSVLASMNCFVRMAKESLVRNRSVIECTDLFNETPMFAIEPPFPREFFLSMESSKET